MSSSSCLTSNGYWKSIGVGLFLACMILVGGAFHHHECHKSAQTLRTTTTTTTTTIRVVNPLEGISLSTGTNEELEKVNKCPGSKSLMHAQCSLDIEFPQVSCTDVREEIVQRIKKNLDPKSHRGTYKLIDNEKGYTTASRTTGDGTNYTDLFRFTYRNLRKDEEEEEKEMMMLESSNKGCKVTACSESQVRSVGDYSTNYCNMRNLYCQGSTTTTTTESQGNSISPCKTQKHDLKTFTEHFGLCLMHNVKDCTR